MIKRIHSRGGSWYYDASIVLAAYRPWHAPSHRAEYFGFRIVRSFE